MPYLDNLKLVLIAAIIAIHGVLGYVSADQWWSYADVQEVTLAPVTEVLLFVLVAPFALFMIALLFLVAGLLTPPAMARKGPGRFVRDRLLRLGVPFAVFTFVLWPTLLYALYHPLGEAPGSFGDEYVGAEGNLDTGPLWFVGVLLVFSCGYAGGVRLRQRGSAHRPAHRPTHRGPREVTVRHLLLLAGGVAVATFVVRLVHPAGSESVTDLNLWEWPACIALFGLGVTASGRGWLTEIPEGLRRASRTVTLLGIPAMAAVLATTGALGVSDELTGGPHWPALLFATVEGTLTVFGSVWLLGLAQRRLNRTSRRLPALSQAAYGAFLVQGPVLIGLAVALRPTPLPAEVKALLVACGAVAGSFAVAVLLIRRVPPLGRILR